MIDYDILPTRMAYVQYNHDHLNESRPTYRDFRTGDVPHSQADISKSSHLLGHAPTHSVEAGLDVAMGWYMKKLPDEKRTDTQC